MGSLPVFSDGICISRFSHYSKVNNPPTLLSYLKLLNFIRFHNCFDFFDLWMVPAQQGELAYQHRTHVYYIPLNAIMMLTYVDMQQEELSSN